MNGKKIVVGMSGGVDSSVTAALLLEQGYDVSGVFLECWRAPGCRVDEDRKDAMDVALGLGIPFQVLDFKKAYKERVVDYFYREYVAGRTPNPDVMCNREIKFGMFYEWAMGQGFDGVATGHYAQIADVDGKKVLLRGVDQKKDQSYFLYLLRQDQLEHVLFPLGDMTKKKVREKAISLGLTVADKKDSQGICFVGEVSIRDFLMELGMCEQQGRVVFVDDAAQREIGVHDGVGFLTVGQRGGFRITHPDVLNDFGHDPRSLPPFYVVDKDAGENVLVVGERKHLMRDCFEVSRLHLIDLGEDVEGRDLLVRMRHGGDLIPCKYDSGQVVLSEPVFGVAPGQACVFYEGEVCLGGGIIA